MIRGIYSSGTGDFVTAVDEGHIILIKSLDSTDDYDTIRSTADMLVNAINTEAMVNVRLSFGTIIPELKEVSQSYKKKLAWFWMWDVSSIRNAIFILPRTRYSDG